MYLPNLPKFSTQRPSSGPRRVLQCLLLRLMLLHLAPTGRPPNAVLTSGKKNTSHLSLVRRVSMSKEPIEERSGIEDE